jgi:hypothetical protein
MIPSAVSNNHGNQPISTQPNLITNQLPADIGITTIERLIFFFLMKNNSNSYNYDY